MLELPMQRGMLVLLKVLKRKRNGKLYESQQDERHEFKQLLLH